MSFDTKARVKRKAPHSDVDDATFFPPTQSRKGVKKNPPSFSSELVAITTGNGEEVKSFPIHKEFACHYSPIFNAAFNSNFFEGQNQSYHLEETDEETLQLLLQWLYSKQLSIPEMQKNGKRVPKDRTKTLVHLWILADKLLIPALMNNALQALDDIQTYNKTIYVFSAKFIYDNTVVGSPLRKYMVDQAAFLSHSSEYKKLSIQKDSLPYEFLLDVVVALTKKAKNEDASLVEEFFCR